MPNYNRYSKHKYVYTKLRRNFGRQPLFQAPPPVLLDSICPNKEHQKEYMLRNPVHKEVQAVLSKAEHDANTKELVFVNKGINHLEGGWPREIQADNEEAVHRYCRHAIHDNNYINTVMNVAPIMAHCLDQNNAIDMYQSYFSDIPPQADVEKYNVRVANTFRDSLNRPISCIVWTNEKKSRLAVSHCNRVYQTESENSVFNTCNIWDIYNQYRPVETLEPLYPCWQLACSPLEPDVFLAGLQNGTVNLFDVRSSKNAESESSVYNSHRDPITGLLYMHSRTNTEFFTGSSDGQCLFWDTRNLSQPTDSLPMSIKRSTPNEELSMEKAESVSCLNFDRGLPTKFLCGTDSGLVINVNRMGKTPNEVLCSYWNAHDGPVRAVHRSPCTLRMFLTCGDWTVRVWSEEVRTAPIIVTSPYRHQVNDIAWSPRRFSSYMSVCSGGFFYYWDLLRKYKDPLATLQVSKYKLTQIKPNHNGKKVVVGDSNGCIFLLELPENMVLPGHKDKQLMHQTYDRETKREHILDNRQKEIRLKIKEAEIELETAEIDIESLEDEEVDANTEEEYWRIVNDELRAMSGSVVSVPD